MDLYKKVESGDTDAMLEVSEWYRNQGSTEKAITWAAFSVLKPESAYIEFDEALALLKKDIKVSKTNQRKSDITAMKSSIMEKLVLSKSMTRQEKIKLAKGGASESGIALSPKVKGMDIIVVYERCEKYYKLVHAFTATAESIDVTNGAFLFFPDVICRGRMYIDGKVMENTFIKAIEKKTKIKVKEVPYVAIHATVFVKTSKKQEAKNKGISDYRKIALLMNKPVVLEEPMKKIKEEADKIKKYVAEHKSKKSEFPIQRERYDELKDRYTVLKKRGGDKDTYSKYIDVVSNQIALIDENNKAHCAFFQAEIDFWLSTSMGLYPRVHTIGYDILKWDTVKEHRKRYKSEYPERELAGFRIIDFMRSHLVTTILFEEKK